MKLTMEQVIEKARTEIRKALRNHGRNLPIQEREEVEQKVLFVFYQKYQAGEINESLNWEGLISKSMVGYVRNHKRDRRNERALMASCQHEFSIEDLCDQRNQSLPEVGSAMSDRIRWELLARLCSVDKELKVFVLFNIFNYTLNEVNELFGRSSEKRMADLNYEFLERLQPVSNDNPIVKDPWMRQVLYALGISRLYGLEPIDQELGWKLDPVEFGPPPDVNKIEQINFDFLVEKVG